MITGEEIDDRRRYVRPLLDWATNGSAGVSEDHANYRLVTEGRDVGKSRAGYSSCGDLAHWTLFRAGVRSSWINRAEHQGWKVGVNVSRLAFSAPASVRRTPGVGARFELGDVLIIWNRPDGTDAHVMVVYSHDSLELTVSEYGQPGGHTRARPLTVRGDRLYVGARQIQRWLPFAAVVSTAAEAGELVDMTFPEGLSNE